MQDPQDQLDDGYLWGEGENTCLEFICLYLLISFLSHGNVRKEKGILLPYFYKNGNKKDKLLKNEDDDGWKAQIN